MRRALSLLAALSLVLGTASTLHAQTATGQITGTVTDTSGAIMAKVKVTVTNQQTGLTRESTTNDLGAYTVPLLPVGEYMVTAEQAGFKLAVNSGIQLNVDQVQRIDLQLAAGDLSETVEVTANATAIDSATASIGQVISEKQVTELPLNGRNFIQLLFLGAGAVEAAGEQGRHAAGCRQRHQHHGLPADVEQLHDRRHSQRRHVARARPRPFSPSTSSRSSRSRPPRIPPSTASAPTRSTSSASRARTRFTARRSTSSATRSWTRGISSTTTMLRSRSSIRSSPGSTWAGPCACRSTTAATRRSSCSTTRRRASREGPAPSTRFRIPLSSPDNSRRPIIDPTHRPAVPEQHHPAGPLVAPRAPGRAVVPCAEYGRRAGKLPAGAHAAADAGSVHDPRRPGPGQVRTVVRPHHEDDVRQQD